MTYLEAVNNIASAQVNYDLASTMSCDDNEVKECLTALWDAKQAYRDAGFGNPHRSNGLWQ